MKKAFTLLVALAMVVGFAGIAAADCLNCFGTAGNIDRGCEGSQDDCTSFDFERMSDYACGETKTKPNRAVFKICDCITDGDFDTIAAGDTVDISMEILVNGETGDNGVYWAEDISTTGIDMLPFENQDLACVTSFDQDLREYEYVNLDSNGDAVVPGTFIGPYKYLKADGTAGTVDEAAGCTLADDSRVVKIVRDGNQFQGYVVRPEDETAGNASWVIDIPWMRVDPAMVSAGDQVWVRICLNLYCGGICTADQTCCCDVYIGSLCCPDSADLSTGSLIYPYFPPADSAAFNLLGMTITNLGMAAGSATITMYEDDGDMGTLDITIPARGIYLATLANLAAEMTSTGTLGDAKSYLTVVGNFPATGFAMIADTVDGASMGYLPIRSE